MTKLAKIKRAKKRQFVVTVLVNRLGGIAHAKGNRFPDTYNEASIRGVLPDYPEYRLAKMRVTFKEIP